MRIPVKLKWLVLGALCAFSAYAREPITLARNPNITSAANAMVLKEIYRQAGLELIVVTMPGLRGSVEASAGRVGGEVNRVASYGDLHPTLIRVAPPIYHWTLSAFHKKSVNAKIKTADDLNEYSVGFVRGLVAAQYFLEKRPDAQQTNGSDALISMLKVGRIDIAVDGTNEFNFYLRTLDYQDIEQQELARYPLHHYLHEKNQDLVPVIGAIIQRLTNSGELTKMYARAEAEFVRSGADPMK